MKRINTIIISGIAAAMASCTTTADKTATVTPIEKSVPSTKPAPQYLPKAKVYKTNRPVVNHVAVRVSPSGNDLVYYPAPSDIHETSQPLELADGWLLDRQGGIGEDTRFLRYTYAEYAALPKTPTTTEILSAVMDDVKVTAVRTLDITHHEARSDTAKVNSLLRFQPKVTNITR